MNEESSNARGLDYVAELRRLVLEAVSEEAASLNAVELLQQHELDIKIVFAPPKKNDAHRRELQSGKVNLGGVQCDVNKEFIDNTLQLSDFLEIDELLAAEYLELGSQTQNLYDRDAFNTALYIFFATRELYLDALRIFLRHLAEDNEDSIFRIKGMLLLDAWGSSPKSLAQTISDNLVWLEQKVSSIELGDKREKLLGSALLLEDRIYIEKSLANQHEMLCILEATVVGLKPHDITAIKQSITRLQNVDSWNHYTSHHVLCVILAIQRLSLATTSERYDEAFSTEIQVKVFRELFHQLRASTDWRCRPILCVLQLVLATELSGFCRSISEAADEFDYEQEILLIARSAVDSHVFQHLITFSMFSERDVTISHPFSMFFKPDALSHYHSTRSDHGSESMSLYLNTCLRHLILALIVNLADLLKEMQLNAEDQMLSLEASDSPTTEEMDHSLDLFYGVVYTAYAYSPDLAKDFWTDHRSNLYGFMVWASNVEVPSTVYAYFKMMSALVKGSDCARASLVFFDVDEASSRDEQRSRPSENSSWQFIFDSFRYYIGQLDRRPGGDFQEAAELDPQNALILESYITLIHTVLRYTGENEVLSRVNTKYEALTIAFQLLSQRLPAELYSALFRLISIFASSPDLQKIIWQMLEAWLGAMDLDVQTALLTSTTRSRQIEHRPLNSLSTFVLISPNSTIELVNCLAALLKNNTANALTLPFPSSLGDNSRYPGVADYVEFVHRCFLSAQSSKADVDIVQRIRTSSCCLHFFETCLTNLDLRIISLSQLGLAQENLANPQFSVQDYFKLHPGAKVLQQLRFAELRDAILNVIRVHDTTDSVVRDLLIPVVAAAIRVCKFALDKADVFEEFVAPLDSATAITHGSLSKDIAHDPAILVHVSLLCADRDVACARASLAFLKACGRKGLLTEQHFTILCSSDQSKTILLGLINVIEDHDTELMQNKLDLLEFISNDLAQHRNSYSLFSISHFILGFTPDNAGGKLCAGDEIGHISSGRSMLHTLLNVLSGVVIDENSTAMISEMAEVASSILLILCESAKTSFIVLPLVREQDYLEAQSNRQLQVVRENPEARTSDEIINISSSKSLCTIRSRSSFMRYCAKEILTCKSDSLHDVETNYVQALFPISGKATNHGVILLDWLDILNINFSQMEIKKSWQYFKLDTYMALLEEVSLETLEKLPLALSMNLATLLAKPNLVTQKTQIDAEYTVLLQHLSKYIYEVLLSKAIYECMTEWSTLTAVIFDSLLEAHQAERRFSADLLQALFVRLPMIQEANHDLADILCESTSTLMRATEHLEITSFYTFFRTSLACLQSPAATQTQREHLYLTGIASLQAIQKRRPFNETNFDPQLASICKAGVDRLLTVICQDAGVQEDLIRITACAFLDLLLKMCEDPSTYFLSQRIVRLNLLTRFAYQFEVSLQGRNQQHPEALSRQFDLILRLAMTRSGAQDLIRNRSLLIALGEKFLRLEDGTEDITNAMRLLSVYIACVIAMGLQTSVSQALLQNFQATWAEKLSEHARRMLKTKHAKHQEFESMLQLISSLQMTSASIHQ